MRYCEQCDALVMSSNHDRTWFENASFELCKEHDFGKAWQRWFWHETCMWNDMILENKIWPCQACEWEIAISMIYYVSLDDCIGWWKNNFHVWSCVCLKSMKREFWHAYMKNYFGMIQVHEYYLWNSMRQEILSMHKLNYDFSMIHVHEKVFLKDMKRYNSSVMYGAPSRRCSR